MNDFSFASLVLILSQSKIQGPTRLSGRCSITGFMIYYDILSDWKSQIKLLRPASLLGVWDERKIDFGGGSGFQRMDN